MGSAELAEHQNNRTTPRQPIGMIGLGLLGSALAERMLRAGYEIHGYDLSAERLAEHIARGGRAVESIAEVAARQTIVLCLPVSNIVEQVIQQLRPTISPGTLLID